MEKTKTKQKNKLLLILAVAMVALVAGIVVLVTQFTGSSNPASMSANELVQALAKPGDAIIRLDGDVVLEGTATVNGNKTITGTGTIMLSTALEGQWPEEEKPSWGIGCSKLEAQQASSMASALVVSKDCTLTLSESIIIDASGNANGILVESNAKLTVSDEAGVKNGRYANLVVAEGAQATIAGGNLLDGNIYNVINYGKLDISGGTVSGAKSGAVVYTIGTVTQTGGTISKSGVHNVYVAAGTFTMTGGINDSAAKDGIVVAKGATAEVTGGEINNCIHGLCNYGDLKAGEVKLMECGIMNNEDANLNIKGTSVDTSEVYCLANSGGKVYAEDFTAKKCDTCTVYNFSGDMEFKNLTISGSRDGNIANAGGNLIINGATLGICRDKSVTVGNGKAVLNDVTIEGTDREKYGVYTFGGELYLNNCSIKDVSSSAVKADAGSYVELNNVTIKDVAQNGFQSDGGRIVGKDVSMTNMGSHGIYNNGGDIVVEGLTIDTVKKNGVQHKYGTTTISDVTAKDMGNHGAYVQEGTLTVKDAAFTTMAANGFYIVSKENKLVLENVAITGAVQQGINSSSVVEVKDVTISKTGKNGIYNKVGGTMTINGLTVTDVAGHGVNNKATMTASNVTVVNSGAGSNGIQNNGTLVLKGASITNSKNHGIYNNGKLTAEAVTVTGTADNGVYNDKGEATITGLTITKAAGQGVNNNATITLCDVKISDTGKNGIYNSDGAAKVEKLTISGTAEHGVNNAGKMTLTNAEVKATGDGKNGLQNSGDLTVKTLSVSDSKNHGIYNNGKLTAEAVTVTGTADNGVYNDKGEATITGLTITKAAGQGLNNNATITLCDVKISDTGKNGIYNSDGTAKVEKLTVSGTAEHGVNNAGKMTLTNAEVKATGIDKNGIQNSGDLVVTIVSVSGSKNHGIYNNGKLSGTDVTVTEAAKNGVFNDGGTVDNLKKLSVSGVGEQGINNSGSLVASDVKISKTGKNGVYNNGGTAVVSALAVTDPGEHGVSNKGTITLSEAAITGSAYGNNCIQNNGTMTLENVKIKDSQNHGIYNDSTLVTKGDLDITGAAVNGIYNYNGNVTIDKATITTSGEHGINNAGKLTGKNVTIDAITQNGIQNSGEMTVETVTITNSGKHGIYNGGRFVGKELVIEDAGDLLLNNGGELLKVTGITLTGKANKAIYNSGYAEFYGLTVDGANVKNASNADQQWLVDNNGGVLDLNDATIFDAFGTALHNRGKAATSVTNVVLDGAGNYGIFIEGGSKLSGDGLVVNNITKNEQIAAAEGYAIKNQGTITMMDHVTLGDYADSVTGDGKTARKQTSGIASTALTNDAASASYAGYDLVIRNAPAGNGIYNKGILYVTDLDIDGTNNGLVCRYTGWATLAGTVKITNTTKCPVSIYGPEDNDASINGVTLVSGTDMLIDTAGEHGINNKGSFLAAADTSLTIQNIIGRNVNAINNQSTGTMKLGNVTVDGVYVTISMYNDTTINSNSGNGLQTNSALVLNGDLVIRNIYIKAANNKTDNSNGSGVVVKNGGSITGTGSITVIGSQTAPEGYEDYTGLFNGIFTTKCTIDIDGDVSVSNAKNQGIYVADANAKLEAGNITVTDTASGGNSIYINNASGSMTASGNIVVSNSGGRSIHTYGNITASGDIRVTNSGGDNAIYVRSNCKIKAANLSVKQTTGNGIRFGAADGSITVTGKIAVEDTAQHGIYNSHGGDITAKDMQIKNVGGGYNGLHNGGGGNIVLTGDLVISGVSGTHTGENCYGNGMYFKNGKLNVTGNVTITDVTAASTHADDTHTVNNGLYNEGATMEIGGDLTVKNVVTHAVNNKGTLKVAGKIDTDTSGKRGINNTNQLVAGNVTIKAAGENGIQNSGTLIVGSVDGNNEPQLTGALTLQNCTGHGFYNSGTIMAGSITITQTNKNGINNAGTVTVGGAITTGNTKTDGIGNSATLTAGAITVSDVTGGKGLNNSGTVTAASISISNTSGDGISSTGAITVTGDITTSTTGGNGIIIKQNLSAANVTVTNATGHGLCLNAGNISVTVTGNIVINGATNRGISNTQAGSTVTAGNITVSNVTGENGIANGNATSVITADNITVQTIVPTQNGITNKGQILVSNNLTIDGVSGTTSAADKGNGLWNSGTVVVGNKITVSNVTSSGSTDHAANNGINNTGSILAGSVDGQNNISATGTIEVSGVSAGHGIHGKGGSIAAKDITITGVTGSGKCGMYLENSSTTYAAGTITVDSACKQSIQIQYANSLTADKLIVKNSVDNGLRIYNAADTKGITVQIGTVIASNCASRGIAAQQTIASDNTISITNVYYSNCPSGGIHDRVKPYVTNIYDYLPADPSAGNAEN